MNPKEHRKFGLLTLLSRYIFFSFKNGNRPKSRSPQSLDFMNNLLRHLWMKPYEKHSSALIPINKLKKYLK